MPPIFHLSTVLATLAVSGLAHAQPTFSGLGNLGGGVQSSDAWGISRDGTTVLGSSPNPDSGLNDAAFRSIGGGPIAVLAAGGPGAGIFNNDLPGGTYMSRAVAACLDGGFIVGTSAYNGVRTHAFWFGPGGTALVDLGNIANQMPPLDAANDISAAEAISDFSEITVGRGFRQATGQVEACFWRFLQPGAIGIGDLPGGITRSDAHGVSGDGRIIVGEGNSFAGREAFTWTDSDGMFGLGDAPGGAFDSTAYAASRDGSVIVGYVTTAAGAEAAVWRNRLLTVLGDLPGGVASAVAYALTADGRVIVGAGDAGLRNPAFPTIPISEAFVWTGRHGMRRIADVLGNALPVGWVLNSANGVTLTGSATVIVGSGTNPNGNNEAWIAELPRYCAADINDTGDVSVQDIFDFLVAYFANNSLADFNGVGGVSVQDVFDFLVAYFGGC